MHNFSFPDSQTVSHVRYSNTANSTITITCRNANIAHELHDFLSEKISWENIALDTNKISIPYTQTDKTLHTTGGHPIYGISPAKLAKALVVSGKVIKNGEIYTRLNDNQTDELRALYGTYQFNETTPITHVDVLFDKKRKSPDWQEYNRYSGEYHIFVKDKNTAQKLNKQFPLPHNLPQQDTVSKQYYIAAPIYQFNDHNDSKPLHTITTIDRLVTALKTPYKQQLHHCSTITPLNDAEILLNSWLKKHNGVMESELDFTIANKVTKPLIPETAQLQKIQQQITQRTTGTSTQLQRHV